MSDPRIQYIARRVEIAFEGLNYKPSISTLFENLKVCNEICDLFKSDGPQCIAFYCQVLFFLFHAISFRNFPLFRALGLKNQRIN